MRIEDIHELEYYPYSFRLSYEQVCPYFHRLLHNPWLFVNVLRVIHTLDDLRRYCIQLYRLYHPLSLQNDSNKLLQLSLAPYIYPYRYSFNAPVEVGQSLDNSPWEYLQLRRNWQCEHDLFGWILLSHS